MHLSGGHHIYVSFSAFQYTLDMSQESVISSNASSFSQSLSHIFLHNWQNRGCHHFQQLEHSESKPKSQRATHLEQRKKWTPKNRKQEMSVLSSDTYIWHEAAESWGQHLGCCHLNQFKNAYFIVSQRPRCLWRNKLLSRCGSWMRFRSKLFFGPT